MKIFFNVMVPATQKRTGDKEQRKGMDNRITCAHFDDEDAGARLCVIGYIVEVHRGGR